MTRRIALPIAIAAIIVGVVGAGLAATGSGPFGPSATQIILDVCGAGRGPNGSCEPLPTPFSLFVNDVDGPPIELLIGGHVVAEVRCSDYIRLYAGTGMPSEPGSVPPLPWSLDVRQQGGPLLKHFDVMGGENFTLLVRADGIALGEFGSYDPTSDPHACERWAPSPSGS